MSPVRARELTARESCVLVRRKPGGASRLNLHMTDV